MTSPIPRVYHLKLAHSGDRDQQQDCQGRSSHVKTTSEGMVQPEPHGEDQAACLPGLRPQHTPLQQRGLDSLHEAGEETQQLLPKMPASHPPYPLAGQGYRRGSAAASGHDKHDEYPARETLALARSCPQDGSWTHSKGTLVRSAGSGYTADWAPPPPLQRRVQEGPKTVPDRRSPLGEAR